MIDPGHHLGLSYGLTPAEIVERIDSRKQRATVSPSQIEAFERCPLQAFGRSVLRVGRPDVPSQPLVLGSTVDAVLGYVANGHKTHDAWEFSLIEHRLDELYPDARAEAVRQVQHGIEMMPDARQIIGTQIELPANAPQYNGLRLHGFADLVYYDRGLMCIRDWKTSKRPPTLRPGASGISVQLGIYALGLRACEWWGGYGCDPDRVRVEYGMTRDGRVKGCVLDLRDLDRFETYLEHVTERIAAYDPPHPIPNRLCDWCDFREHCPAHGASHPDTEGIDMGILDQARRASDHTAQFLNLMVYGPPGVGKTWLAGSAARAGFRALLLDCESGSMTIRDTSAAVLTIDSMQGLEQAYTEIRAGLEAGALEYDVIFLDSVTELQKLHIDEITGKGKRDMKLPDWGKVNKQTRQIVRAFRDLPIHVGVFALSKEIIDEHSGQATTRMRPSVHGQTLPHELAGFFDVVGYAGVSKGEHVIAFTGSDRVIAKDRSGALDPVEPNDFGLIFGKIYKGTELAAKG